MDTQRSNDDDTIISIKQDKNNVICDDDNDTFLQRDDSTSTIVNNPIYHYKIFGLVVMMILSVNCGLYFRSSHSQHQNHNRKPLMDILTPPQHPSVTAITSGGNIEGVLDLEPDGRLTFTSTTVPSMNKVMQVSDIKKISSVHNYIIIKWKPEKKTEYGVLEYQYKTVYAGHWVANINKVKDSMPSSPVETLQSPVLEKIDGQWFQYRLELKPDGTLTFYKPHTDNIKSIIQVSDITEIEIQNDEDKQPNWIVIKQANGPTHRFNAYNPDTAKSWFDAIQMKRKNINGKLRAGEVVAQVASGEVIGTLTLFTDGTLTFDPNKDYGKYYLERYSARKSVFDIEGVSAVARYIYINWKDGPPRYTYKCGSPEEAEAWRDILGLLQKGAVIY